MNVIYNQIISYTGKGRRRRKSGAFSWELKKTQGYGMYVSRSEIMTHTHRGKHGVSKDKTKKTLREPPPPPNPSR